MTKEIAERLERRASEVKLLGDGFQPIAEGNALVMGTPTLITLTTFALQWVSGFTAGGADKLASGITAEKGEAPSLEELISMHEDRSA
ncbi:hypothetical protein [Microbacterium sp. NPDC091662]|uniref:hypothetical protein n=1 Tax=Microbacterium sp. NPDC091662 TaxID=3364211 RepID=UPI003829DE3D